MSWLEENLDFQDIMCIWKHELYKKNKQCSNTNIKNGIFYTAVQAFDLFLHVTVKMLYSTEKCVPSCCSLIGFLNNESVNYRVYTAHYFFQMRRCLLESARWYLHIISPLFMELACKWVQISFTLCD